MTNESQRRVDRVDTELREEPLNVREPAPVTREASPAVREAGPAVTPGEHPLFYDDEVKGFRTRWEAIQTGFVDEPKAAVEQADALVDEMMKRLTEMFGAERSALEQQWSRGENVSTEDLRVSLKRYRSFFGRLLSV